MMPHLPRCQGLAVVYYDFALGRLESGSPSTFAQLGYHIKVSVNLTRKKRSKINRPIAGIEYQINQKVNYWK